MTPYGDTAPQSGLCRLPNPLAVDGDRWNRITSAVNVPTPKSGVEAIGEWKRFPLGRRGGQEAPLAATPLGRELGFLLEWTAMAPFGPHVSAVSLVVSALDGATRPHTGPPGHWRLLVPLDEYPHLLHVCGNALFATPWGTALAIAPGDLSSAGCFGRHEALHLMVDVTTQDLGRVPGLSPCEWPGTLGRRRFGAAQLAAVSGLGHLLNDANFERIFDLLCMLPFDFEIDVATPLVLAQELAGRSGRPELIDRAETLHCALLGAPKLSRVA